MENERKPEITIRTNGIAGTEILVDGKKLDGVTGFRFSQSYKENSGLPILQIDLMATNVGLDTQMLPELPEPFNGHYVSVASLLNSRIVPRETAAELCREGGINLCVLPSSQETELGPYIKKQVEHIKSRIDLYVQQCVENDITKKAYATLEKIRGLDTDRAESLSIVHGILADWVEYAKEFIFETGESGAGHNDKI
ncbi:MAG: hypothetical protein HFH59_09640 [Lachnospiraceae bacterium]|nr:hypothetical protein [Lachnospiraceae bacterium]